MTQVKTFNAKISDEYGGQYPQAIIAIRAFSETSQNTGYSENCTDEYQMESELDAITYQANYWYTAQTKAQGRRSRPLVAEVDGAFTDVFEVDLGNPAVTAVLESNLPHTDKILRAVELDLIRRFA